MQVLEQVVYGLTVGAVYSLIALGYSMMFRAIGLLNFAHQEFMMLGGLLGYTLLAQLHLPVVIAVAVSAVICGLLSMFIERIGIFPIRRQNAPMDNQIVATIGWGLVIVNVSMLTWGAYALNYPREGQAAPLNFLGMTIATQNLLVLAIGVVAMIVLHGFLTMTPTGQAMRATAEDASTAELMGIDIDRMVSITFGISGALGGAAGVLIGSLYYASFDNGLLGLKSLSAAVLGGFGSVPGAMAGGLILGVIENLGQIYVSSAYSDVIAYGLLIVVLLIWPRGLFGRRQSGIG